MTKLMNWIGGEFVEPSTKAWFPHLAPATGQAAVDVPDSDVLDVVKAIQAANKAWTTWQKVDAAQRAGYLMEIADRFEAHAEELALVQSRDSGVPISHSRTVSLPRAVETLRAHARLILQDVERATVSAQALFYQNRLPIGVVAAITPWTDAILAMTSRLAPAVAAGNVLILKPSEYAPESAESMARILALTSLPAGVVNIVQGRGEAVGQAIVSHPGLSTVSFMGRTDTGRSVLRESAEFLKKTHLALGARNPVLVFADLELEKTLPWIAETCLYPGSSCLRGSRLFVQETIYERFLELFKTHIEKLQIGDPLDAKTRLGPMISAEEQKRFFQAIEQGMGEKGKVLTGGLGAPEGLPAEVASGFFVCPTVLFDLTLCSTLQQEDVQGPLITVSSFKYQHDAIKQANTSPFGQAAYVFHRDAAKVARIATKIEAGRVFLNSGAPLWEARLGSGGLKTSGHGREGGDELLRFFTRETLIGQNIASS